MKKTTRVIRVTCSDENMERVMESWFRKIMVDSVKFEDIKLSVTLRPPSKIDLFFVWEAFSKTDCEMIRLIGERNFAQAIKTYQDKMQCGLQEAKDYIDELRRNPIAQGG